MKRVDRRKEYLLLALLLILLIIVLGTRPVKQPEQPLPGATYCTPEQRGARACILLYAPVCGWNDPEKIQCIRYPCAQTYGNSCFACTNANVLYYTQGECPA